MEDLSKQIRVMEKLSRSLGEVNFTYAPNKDGFAVKCGEKLNIIECPDEATASSLSCLLNKVFTSQKAEIEDKLASIALKCEELNLFLQ